MPSAALAPLAGHLELAFVFGSVARGEEVAGISLDAVEPDPALVAKHR